MRCGFLLGWCLMAASVATSLHGDNRWSEGFRVSFPTGFAIVLLVLSAIARFVAVRIAEWAEATEALHALELAGAAMLLVALFLLWGGFFLADLQHARFALVLLAVPAVAIGFVAALSVDARLEHPGSRVFWWALVALTLALAVPAAAELGALRGQGATPPMRWIAALGLLVTCAMFFATSGTFPVQRMSRAPRFARALFVLASGGFVGLAAVWPLFVDRSQNGGCSGISDAFDATVLGTSLALHGAAPFALAALLDDPP